MKGDAENGGVFRATFEDKISMGDIVFCRVWVPIEVGTISQCVLSFFLNENVARLKSFIIL